MFLHLLEEPAFLLSSSSAVVIEPGLVTSLPGHLFAWNIQVHSLTDDIGDVAASCLRICLESLHPVNR